MLGYTPLPAGVRLLPIVTMMLAAPGSGIAVERLGAKAVVTAGLLVDALGPGITSTVGQGSGYGPVALGLAVIGIGNGLAMAPATATIMGLLPPGKFGVGSAMNDTTRMVGRGAWGRGDRQCAQRRLLLLDRPRRCRASRRRRGGGQQSSNSVGAATQVAASWGRLEGRCRRRPRGVHRRAGHGRAGVDRLTLAGALVALLFLPARPGAATAPVEPAAAVGTDDQAVTP